MSGPINWSTYNVSGYEGFFVDVEAHKGRCTDAPAFASVSHRGPLNVFWKAAYASRA